MVLECGTATFALAQNHPAPWFAGGLWRYNIAMKHWPRIEKNVKSRVYVQLFQRVTRGFCHEEMEFRRLTDGCFRTMCHISTIKEFGGLMGINVGFVEGLWGNDLVWSGGISYTV